MDFHSIPNDDATATIAEDSAATKQETLSQIAMRALLQSKGDRDAAVNLLTSWIDGDRQLRNRLIGPIITEAIYSAVRHSAAQDRSSIATTRIRTRPGADDTRGIGLRADCWWTYSMPNGKALGNCKKADLMTDAAFHRLQARSNDRKACLFERIAARLDNERTVRSVFTEDEIAALWEKCRNEK